MGTSVVVVVVVTVLMAAVFACLCDSKCDIKGIFNFGDSNTDTGGFNAAFPSQRAPYGMTFFRKPVGRASDGRLITDFLAQAIGIPFLSPYLKSIGSDFRHGVNYATGGSTELYGIGGRTFWVLNLAPIGCYPAFLVDLPHNSSDVDEFGCMISYNKAVEDYNNLLKKALEQTRADLPDAFVIYVDTHSVLLDLIQHPKSYGLKYGTKACCGYGGEPYNYNLSANCGNPPRLVDGRNLTATVCADPDNYVSWDGLHATETANKFVTKAILNESIFDPPFPLHRLCDLYSIDEQLRNPDLHSIQ